MVLQNIQMQMSCHIVSINIIYSSSCDNYKSFGNSKIIAIFADAVVRIISIHVSKTNPSKIELYIVWSIFYFYSFKTFNFMKIFPCFSFLLINNLFEATVNDLYLHMIFLSIKLKICKSKFDQIRHNWIWSFDASIKFVSCNSCKMMQYIKVNM